MSAGKIEVNSIVQNPSREVVTVKVGNVTVRILPTVKGGREYWLIEDYSRGRRRRRLLNARTLAKAMIKAKKVAVAIEQGRKDILGLKDDDLLAFNRAKELLTEYHRPVGVVVGEWNEAMKALKGKGTVLDAVRFFMAHGGPDLTPCKWTAASAELQAVKKAQGVSSGYLASMKSRLRRFEKVFGKRDLHTIRTAELSEFILGLNCCAGTQNQFRMSAFMIYEFAQTKGWVPRDYNPAADIRQLRIVDSDVAFFSTGQVRKLLSIACAQWPEVVPYLALCAFAGLRPESEASKARWEWIGRDYIRLPGKATKTRKSRLIPVLPNLAAWLAPHRQTSGLVLPPKVNVKNVSKRLAALTGVVWIKDGLRHSFGTHRQAVIKNIHQLVEEMGNSVRIARTHYVNPLVTPEEGAAWFAILPEGSEKILALSEAATA